MLCKWYEYLGKTLFDELG